MAFKNVPLRIIGGTNQNRSAQANNQLTKNWFPEVTPDGIAPAILLPWVGSQAFASNSGVNDRGTHVFNNELYHVVDQTLYKVSSAGVYTSIGTVTGSARCIFSNSVVGSLNQMVIAAGNVFTYDGANLVDSGLKANSVTYLNSKSIYPDGGFNFAVSGSGGPTNITSTGSAESATDDLLRPYAFNQWVYMFGTETVEPFYDAGLTTGSPFARIDNAIMQKGLGGFYTIANTDQALYFLGDDSNVYQIIQSQLTNITPPSIVNSLKAQEKSGATAYTITLNGQDYYVLRFASGLTYAYSETLKEWFNLSTGTRDGPYLATSYQRVYDKDIAVDFRTANAIELTEDALDDLGETIQRRRVLAPLTSANLGMGTGKRLKMSRVYFALQTGQGLASGQGSNPKIMVEYSLDGGKTFSTEQWIKFGKLGQYIIKVKFDAMISFYEITFRITVSDPVFCSLHDASIDVKLGGY